MPARAGSIDADPCPSNAASDAADGVGVQLAVAPTGGRTSMTTGESIEVELTWSDERRAVLNVPQGRSILEAAHAAGVNHRSGCEAGDCASCVGRLRSGSVSYLAEPTALTDAQRDRGFVLLCSATPETPCRIEVGTGVLAEVFPELW